MAGSTVVDNEVDKDPVVTPLELIGRLLNEAQLMALVGGIVHVIGPDCRGYGRLELIIHNGGLVRIEVCHSIKPDKDHYPVSMEG